MGAALAVEFSWFSANPFVRNGTAWDKCDPIVLDPSIKKVLYPPYGFEIRREARSSNPREIHIFMEKRLGYMGHPTGWMSITGVRSEMHVVQGIQSPGELSLASRGCWSSMEGGRSMSVVVFVHPDLIDVELLVSKKLVEPTSEDPDWMQYIVDSVEGRRDDPWNLDSKVFSVVPWHYDYNKTARDANVPVKPL
eukprot:TRINITY_DN6036_c0_g1_i1.p1 TRINITY_DN6036_c0_g1~~TRINITY_DN6036_c0_g1_i1.p1  ORF type:complete len:194 (+),score=26.32 TRINITY_DN6036_c0_g1_i1:20-601(+)